jgi:hypothetical protein
MSRKTVSAVIGSFLAVGFALGAMQGCGSSSSSGTNIMSACMQGCTKVVPCLADAGISETVAQCVQNCASSASTDGGTCSNESAIVMAAQACAAKTTCADLEACGATIPQCEHGGTGGTSGTGTGGNHGTGGTGGTSGTGTGGTTGTGGSTGAAGASGTATCASCDKAQTCCLALAALLGQSTSSCTFSTSSCNAMTGSAQTTDAMTCGTILSSGAALSASCK